jgi:hypothetical protein
VSKKVQLPVIGGIRKVVEVAEMSDVGTTIEGYPNTTLSIGQLATLLSGYFQTAQAPATGNIGPSGANASIALGPGLSGGGALVGAVPIRLTAPLPMILDENPVDDPPLVIPGPPGPRGATGAAGPLIFDDSIEEPSIIPGPQGMQGPPGPPGPAIFVPDENEDVVFVLLNL